MRHGHGSRGLLVFPRFVRGGEYLTGLSLLAWMGKDKALDTPVQIWDGYDE